MTDAPRPHPSRSRDVPPGTSSPAYPRCYHGPRGCNPGRHPIAPRVAGLGYYADASTYRESALS